MTRRSVDSDYMRKKRHSRRAKDNWRRVKTQPHKYKYGGKKMLREEPYIIAAGVLAIVWIAYTAYWISLVWK